MAAPQRTFIPFDRWLPDAGKLNNPGLRRAWGVVPVYGNYIVAPGLNSIGSNLAEEPLGFGLHANQSATLTHQALGFYGTATKLRRINLSTGGVTDVTRAVGGNYAFGSVVPFWHFHSFGDVVVATNYADEVQYTPTPGSVAFSDMITSTFKPQWRFTFSIGQNLFGANCTVPVTYDGIPTGDNPQLVVWSQNRNLRAFGSENVEPTLVGAGWNSLLNDYGPITGAIGGGFAIVFQRRGHVRIDGPPYEFHERPEGGCLQPDSIVRVGDDVYFWGHRGPSVLRGGNPPVEVLTERSAARTILDSTLLFSDVAADVDFASSDRGKRVHAAVDEVNGLVRWSYLPAAVAEPAAFGEIVDGERSGAFLDYNYIENRLSVSAIRTVDDASEVSQVYGLDSVGPGDGEDWILYAGAYGLRKRHLSTGSDEHFLFSFQGGGFFPVPDQLAPAVFWTPLGKLSEESLSRILRVRPVFAVTYPELTAVGIAYTVRVTAINNPRDEEVSYGPFSLQDDMGWVPTESPWADYHSVEVTFVLDGAESLGHMIAEIEGVEIEYQVSTAKYSL